MLRVVPIRAAKPFGFIVLPRAPLLVLVVLSLAATFGVLVVPEPLRFGLSPGVPTLILGGGILLDLSVHARGRSRQMPESKLTA
jgi:hypothetical protein